MASIFKVGDWDKARRILANLPDRFQKAVDKSLLQEGQYVRSRIVTGIREQAPGGKAFTPLAQITIAIRKFTGFSGTKALIRRGDLRNSITVTRDGDTVFVGIKKMAKNKQGRAMVNVAELNEKGASWRTHLSDKARRFLAMAMKEAGVHGPTQARGGGGHIVVAIRIPPRPFMQPVFDQIAQPADVSKRFMARVTYNLGGDLGGFGSGRPPTK